VIALDCLCASCEQCICDLDYNFLWLACSGNPGSFNHALWKYKQALTPIIRTIYKRYCRKDCLLNKCSRGYKNKGNILVFKHHAMKTCRGEQMHISAHSYRGTECRQDVCFTIRPLWNWGRDPAPLDYVGFTACLGEVIKLTADISNESPQMQLLYCKL
jgi:hypothetical protein